MKITLSDQFLFNENARPEYLSGHFSQITYEIDGTTNVLYMDFTNNRCILTEDIFTRGVCNHFKG